jgi:hypothetical protein
MFSRLSAVALFALLILGVSAPADAQGRRNAMQPQTEPADIKGTVEGVMRGRIGLIDGTKQPWIVAVPNNAKVHVTGTAKADFLRPGLFVEFKGEIDNRGTVKEKVAELTIVTPTQDKPIGIFPDDSKASDAKPGKDKADKGGFGAGAGGPAGGPGGGKASGKAGAKAGGRRGGLGGGTPDSGACRVVGCVTNYKDNKLGINAGRGIVQIELADEPAIKVESADYTLACKGDKISIKGEMLRGSAGLAQAKEVKIELAEPLSGVKKKPTPTKPEPKRPPKRPKKDEVLPEPAANK